MPDYNLAGEARLLQYNNASNEVLVDVTRYALDGDADKYIEMGYSTYLNLEPVIRIRDGCGDFGSGGCQGLLNKYSVLLTIENGKRLWVLNRIWQTNSSTIPLKYNTYLSSRLRMMFRFEISVEPGLSSPMTRTISAAERNRDYFLKTITLYCDYQTCTFNRYEMENIFRLKPIIEYRLEVMQERKLKEFYNNFVECIMVKKSKLGEIGRMAAAAVGDVNVVLDANVCESKVAIYRIHGNDDERERKKSTKYVIDCTIYYSGIIIMPVDNFGRSLRTGVHTDKNHIEELILKLKESSVNDDINAIIGIISTAIKSKIDAVFKAMFDKNPHLARFTSMEAAFCHIFNRAAEIESTSAIFSIFVAKFNEDNLFKPETNSDDYMKICGVLQPLPAAQLTPENDYDMEKRRLTNVMDPANSSDVLNLKYYLSNRNNCGGSRLL
ncbi:hypothetical protein FQA39_LY10812 [Lamprigera yunnana]|nr:hypothetical protein FQA39_LY10812 [Lamprigera yunnana]